MPLPNNLRRSPRAGLLQTSAFALLALAALPAGNALAAGCEGQNATSDSGGRSLDLAIRTQDEVIARARANAGVSATPVYGGVAASGSQLKHDGYRLKNAIPLTDCGGSAVPSINRLQPFETTTWSASGVGEIDVTRQFGLPPTSLLKLGMGVGGKWLETRYRGTLRSTAPTTPSIGVNLGAGKVEEDGVQLDFYSLYASGTTYVVVATSIGFGDTSVRNPAFTGIGGTFGGGTGSTDYRDYTVQAVVGNVFTLGVHGNAKTLLDLSGGLLFARYDRDAFRDSIGVHFGSASTEEFSGKLEAKLAYQVAMGSDSFTPYLKAGVKHRFNYDSGSSVFTPAALSGICAPGVDCDFSANFRVKGDDTFWRAGGGLGFTMGGGKHTGLLELMHQGSGDSSELVGKGQLIFRLN